MDQQIGFPPLARASMEGLQGSLIRSVFAEGAGVPGVIPLWFGEPDEVTPGFIRDVAKRALDDGQTFYNSNFGIDPLRAAIAAYQAGLGRASGFERICVTASGVNAIMLVCQALLDPGDRVVLPEPYWPNLAGIPRVLGAEVVTVKLSLDAGAAWSIDMDALLAALTPGTRMVMLNAPANPTGWMLSRAEQEILLAHCRQHGIWILADDVYERLVFEGRASSSFLDIAGPDDRVVGINSFSKSWAMTGWRLGWITAPTSLMPALGKISEFNVSCAPPFVQLAGIAALEQGEDFITTTVARYRELRDLACARLGAIPGVSVPVPGGAMYCFFAVVGCTDSVSLASRLVHEARVGLAPGLAFGAAGEGCLRLCFAVGRERLQEACARIEGYLTTSRGRG
jgi:aspartate/methionine/tyrosine aminotransferase